MEKRITKPIRPYEVKIEVLGKRPTHPGGLLVRSSSTKDAQILEKEVKGRITCNALFSDSETLGSLSSMFDVPNGIEGAEVIEVNLIAQPQSEQV